MQKLLSFRWKYWRLQHLERIQTTYLILCDFVQNLCSVLPLLVTHKNKPGKMLQTIWHQFSVQFSLLFQVLCSILLAVLLFETPAPDWWKTFNSQSGSTKRLVLKCNTEGKTKYTIWKINENWTEKWCQIICSILFDLFYCMTSSVL